MRTLYQAGKLDNVLKEMARINIDILGLSEVHWTGAGKIQKNDSTVIYPVGVNTAEE